MPQGYLNFNLESTDECLTSNAGTIVFGEYCKAIAFDQLCSNALPAPGSNRGYDPFNHLFPIILMLHSGGRELADMRMIRSDTAMRRLLKLQRLPTDDAVGKWLGRMGDRGAEALQGVNRVLLRRHLKHHGDEPLVLDIDATVIESHKSTAFCTYKGVPGYTPMTGHINGGFMIGSDFRKGNVAPAAENLSFIEKCIGQLPAGRTIEWLRADSASYQSAIFNYCDAHDITFTIGARLDRSTLEDIESIKAWQRISAKEGDFHFYEESAAEVLHTMHDTHNAFRLIVIKKRATPMLPELRDILDEAVLLQYAGEHYSVIATNADESIPIEEIIRFYRQRGDTSENRIKEFKNGFNLSYLPTSNFNANAFYFQIGTIAYNLFILFSKMLEHSWQKHTVATIRYKLYHLAGKLVSHGRRLTLKVMDDALDILRAIRLRILQTSLE